MYRGVKNCPILCVRLKTMVEFRPPLSTNIRPRFPKFEVAFNLPSKITCHFRFAQHCLPVSGSIICFVHCAATW